MLSEKIKKYRLDNKLTQEEFAAKLFVTRNAVSKWENDNGYPNIDTIRDIAKLLDMTIDELLGEDDIKTITINNNDNLNKYKSYIANILVFISYALVAIIVPHLMFLSDPTSVMFYIIFAAPISFVTYDESYSAPIHAQPVAYTLIFTLPIVICALLYIIFKKKS